MKKLTGFSLLALALVLAIAPIFSDCRSQGRTLTTKDGRTVDMKCHWTGVAEIAVAGPLALVGIFNLTSKRKETLRSINIMGIALGALAILIPTALIGVCANPDMICNLIMRPVLILSGVLVIGAAAATLITSVRSEEPSSSGRLMERAV
jgi:hypothetical protein